MNAALREGDFPQGRSLCGVFTPENPSYDGAVDSFMALVRTAIGRYETIPVYGN